MMGAIDQTEHNRLSGINYFNTIHYPRIATEQSGKTGNRKDRPMEHARLSGTFIENKGPTITKTVVKDRKLVVEKYDRNGRLIRLTPPGYIPFDRAPHSFWI
ncbi:MAG: hypothetical protein QNJ26_09880 [Desulfobacterales bacterium]|nr:hypothetical protein [Desulfobacterales bacterium]